MTRMTQADPAERDWFSPFLPSRVRSPVSGRGGTIDAYRLAAQVCVGLYGPVYSSAYRQAMLEPVRSLAWRFRSFWG